MVIDTSDCLLGEDCGAAIGEADTKEPNPSSVEYCSAGAEQCPDLIVPVCLSDSQRRYMKIKHGMDIVLCVIGLALLAVPMGLIALAQKIMYPTEPVFFLQNRVGLGGKIFRIIKFRTMRADAPRDIATRQFENYGENTTPFGAFLRRFSIDELPQLFNVLAGDMALIGPRPLIASEQPIQTLRERSGVYCVRPGITGLAQINGRDRLNDYEKAYYDREYVQNLSCKQDLLIFFRSFSYILMQKDLGKNDNNSDPLFADCDQSAP